MVHGSNHSFLFPYVTAFFHISNTKHAKTVYDSVREFVTFFSFRLGSFIHFRSERMIIRFSRFDAIGADATGPPGRTPACHRVRATVRRDNIYDFRGRLASRAAEHGTQWRTWTRGGSACAHDHAHTDMFYNMQARRRETRWRRDTRAPPERRLRLQLTNMMYHGDVRSRAVPRAASPRRDGPIYRWQSPAAGSQPCRPT